MADNTPQEQQPTPTSDQNEAIPPTSQAPYLQQVEGQEDLYEVIIPDTPNPFPNVKLVFKVQIVFEIASELGWYPKWMLWIQFNSKIYIIYEYRNHPGPWFIA